jgi:hypothetical protein
MGYRSNRPKKCIYKHNNCPNGREMGQVMQIDEIEIINKIMDVLGIEFAWMKYPQGITLPLQSLQTILSAINNLDGGN